MEEFEDTLLDPVIHVRNIIRTEDWRETLMLFVILKEHYKAVQWLSKVITLRGQKEDLWLCANRAFISCDNERSRLGHDGWAKFSTF